MAEIIHTGQNQVGTLGGQVRLEEGNGRLVVYKDNKRVIQIGILDSGEVGIDWYDADTGKNYMRAGELPDDTGGFVVAKPGYNVDELF